MKQNQTAPIKKRGGIKSFLFHLLIISCFSITLLARGLTVSAASAGSYQVSSTVYSDGKGDHMAKIETPKVTSKGRGVDVFNKKMQKYTDSIKKKYLKLGKTELSTVETTYEIMANNTSILSIKIDTTESMGSADTYSKCFTLDKKAGKTLTLKSLFKKNADYVTVISKNIIKQMEKQMKADDSKVYNIGPEAEEMDEAFTKIKKTQNFYISEKGSLIILFDKYEVAPGVMGQCSFTIPKSAVSTILNTNLITK